VVAERPGPRPKTAQGYTIPSDRLVRVGTGKTRSPQLWRVLDATDPQGQRRTILTSLLDEEAERSTQLRAYRWTIEIVVRWLTRVLQSDTLSSVSPAGMARPGALALIASGLLRLYQAGGALALKAVQRRVNPELQGALFAAGVAAGRRQERARTPSGVAPPRLQVMG
jgi:hypothetical protein